MQIFYDPSLLIFFINTRMKKQAAFALDRADVAVQLAAEDRIYNATAVLHLVPNTIGYQRPRCTQMHFEGKRKKKKQK